MTRRGYFYTQLPSECIPAISTRRHPCALCWMSLYTEIIHLKTKCEWHLFLYKVICYSIDVDLPWLVLIKFIFFTPEITHRVTIWRFSQCYIVFTDRHPDKSINNSTSCSVSGYPHPVTTLALTFPIRVKTCFCSHAVFKPLCSSASLKQHNVTIYQDTWV